MALSSSESALLTQTCENMNVAANTCREVLEMLRNLGNTGVVDIASHDNAQGRHAGDKTLVHAAAYGTGSSIQIGDLDGLPYAPLVVNVKSDAYTLGVHTFTMGTGGAVNAGSYSTIDRYFSDSSKTRISFSSNTLTGYYAMHHYDHHLVDADGYSVVASLYFNVGKVGNLMASGVVPPYTCIRPTVTAGTMGAYAQVIEFDSDGVVPCSNNTASLGVSGYAFKDLFVVNSPTVTSDRRAKKDVSALGSQAIDFIKALRPVSYRLKQGEGQIEQFNEDGPIANDTPDREGVRTHWGLIAQEVKEAMASAGYEDVAMWCLADKDDPDSQQSLRYEELIAPMIKVIQNQQERIEALERKVA